MYVNNASKGNNSQEIKATTWDVKMLQRGNRLQGKAVNEMRHKMLIEARAVNIKRQECSCSHKYTRSVDAFRRSARTQEAH